MKLVEMPWMNEGLDRDLVSWLSVSNRGLLLGSTYLDVNRMHQFVNRYTRHTCQALALFL